MRKVITSYKTCPKCKGRHTKLVHLSNEPDKAIECQVCGHFYPFPTEHEAVEHLAT